MVSFSFPLLILGGLAASVWASAHVVRFAWKHRRGLSSLFDKATRLAAELDAIDLEELELVMQGSSSCENAVSISQGLAKANDAAKKGDTSSSEENSDPEKGLLINWRHIAGGSFAVLVGGFLFSRSVDRVPYTRRVHAVPVPVIVERLLGHFSFQTLLAKARSKGKVLASSHPSVIRVRRIVDRLAAVAVKPPLLLPGESAEGVSNLDHLRGIEWEVAVIDSDVVNACVTPGGKVVVHTALLRIYPTDAELATVLGHEIAHVVARHGMEKLVIGSTVGCIIAHLLTRALKEESLVRGVSHLAFNLPHSRLCETEADTIGMHLMAAAGYNPSCCPAVFVKLGKATGNTGKSRMAEFISTHPQSEVRAGALAVELPRAMARFQLLRGLDK